MLKKIEKFLQEWLIVILLILMVIAAFLAYGSPFPVIELLIEGDEIAWRGVKVIFGWIIAGFVIVFIYNWIYDFFTKSEDKVDLDKQATITRKEDNSKQQKK
ncbi:MAG: hypothetical protein AB1765_03490 [Candidatus Hydrogenedentota bacterium]